jgi:hypothetical protein
MRGARRKMKLKSRGRNRKWRREGNEKIGNKSKQ